MFLAIREIKKEKLRFGMIISVTALVAYLIFFLSSLAFGLAQANRTSVDAWKASGVILSSSANRSINASSFDLSEYEALAYEGSEPLNVAAAVVYQNGIEDKEHQFNLVLFGTQSVDSKLIPERIEGRQANDSLEIVVSESIRKTMDLKLGDTVKIARTGRVLTVVGFTEASEYNTVPVAYTSLETASQTMMLYTTGDEDVDAQAEPTPYTPSRINAIVVYDAVDQQQLSDASLEYIPIQQFIEKIPGYQAQVLTFGMMIVFLVLISAIIVGIFMYILTMQKKPIFGILKAQGIRNSYIIRSVSLQTLILTALGVAVGFAATVLTLLVLPPQVPVEMNLYLNLAVSVLTVLCSFIGSLFSARAVLKIDPLQAI